MRLFYTAAYSIGFRPWELMVTLPIRDQISALFDREEAKRKPPFGQALDLGCGTGHWAVNLAVRGWRVTAIDIVGKALRAACKRVRDADVDVRVIQGDVTALRSAGVGSGFPFLLDLGAIHGMKEHERLAVGREVTAVAASDATLLMGAGAQNSVPARNLSQRHRGSVSDWTVIAEDPCDVTDAPRSVWKADPRFYRLRRD